MPDTNAKSSAKEGPELYMSVASESEIEEPCIGDQAR